MLERTSKPAKTARSRRPYDGFTRLEAAIVVAVTAIVAAVGVSALRTYLVRAEIAQSLARVKYVRDHVTRAFRRTAVVPADRASADLPNDGVESLGGYIEEIRVTDGRIDLLFGAEASRVLRGRTLSLTPFETADQAIVWICGNRAPGVGLKPLGFASGGPQAVQVVTAIENRYLPASCR